MLDYVVRGATIVDGSGLPGMKGDIGIRDGRVTTVGAVDESGRTVIDGAGLVAAPGFIDPHTHYDAQLFWDPSVSPSSLHGVTSIVAGNCGFTFAPAGDDDASYLSRLMARVEGMPIEALEQSLPWNWESFAEYLDA